MAKRTDAKRTRKTHPRLRVTLLVKEQSGRYSTPKGPETEFQPGSRRQVLRNSLGITRKGSKRRQETYLAAVTRGYGQDYTVLTRFFAEAIRRRLEETTP